MQSLFPTKRKSFRYEFTGVGIFCLHLQLHSKGYELILNFKNQMCLTFNILSKQEDFKLINEEFLKETI